ncbi:MAG: LemA family protein [bacterium]|jgi:LemA protein|nr:LemA family protein [bacterium]MBK7188657.1 LemA family protein [bacterium]MBK7670523.1 LemA family protein [bacterium]MBK9776577.1 LemA family protein [bacterium]
MKKFIPLIVILGALALTILPLVGQYNKVIGLQEGVDGQWANVENVYQRRADLIPNLVETVKGYAEHERETLEAVVTARAKATQVQTELTPEAMNDPATMQKFQAAQAELGSALGRLMVVVEKYPDLKANQGFLDLQAQLEGTENRITVERRRFNELAQGYNTTIRRFPMSMMAGMFGFDKKGYFEAAEGAEKAPQVKF